MKKENYVSEEIENILVNDFIINNPNQGIWLGRSVVLYILLIKIFKYKMENKIDINFNNSIEYLFDNYKILKDKNLLSLEEIDNFEEIITNHPGVKLTNEKIEYSISAEENFMYAGMSISQYLKESSFVTDFFYMRKNIENF